MFFGDGITFSSLKYLTLPCWIENVSDNIISDVIECNFSLLMSSNSMKKTKTTQNFSNDTIQIDRKNAKSHYIFLLFLRGC